MIRQTWLGLFKIVLSLNAIQKHPNDRLENLKLFLSTQALWHNHLEAKSKAFVAECFLLELTYRQKHS